MPSPFPGMDPYLEAPWLWPDAHHELISASRELLNRHLRPRYVARIEARVYLETGDDPARQAYFPDLRIQKRPGTPKGRRKPAGGGAVGVAEPVAVTILYDLEVSESRIELLAVDTKAVVAVIEVLSPSNKVKGSEGRASFLAKRREVLNSTAHWVEIDLLRAGQAPVFRTDPPPHEYLVTVSPADRRPEGMAWPIRLSQPLPPITIPLRPGDPDVLLDLQEALTLAYDRAAYDMTIDYKIPAVPPLPPELTMWADDLLRAAEVR